VTIIQTCPDPNVNEGTFNFAPILVRDTNGWGYLSYDISMGGDI
jgi:hypothetical protein